MNVQESCAAATDPVQLPSGAESFYGQFCPIAMAAELLATRWTLVLLGEMLSGSTRFNEIRRGVPRMSTALLSQRLRELERARVVVRQNGEYKLTPSGRDLAPIVFGLGRWALKWVDSDCSLTNLDARLLMWNMRRNLQPDPLPARRVVVEFQYPELPPGEARYWLIIAPDQPVDLCSVDPGHEVDLLVMAGLRAMTAAWMGMSSFDEELHAGRITLDGDAALSTTFTRWIGRSRLAEKLA
ncbi:MAG TPA: helix-turn-helix domain-containing protein [Rhizomicrobium sp.]|jgi:DNA-binding HxlR family transcriptional regulator|nr:helix-turn-helix domain-containing protein [Rhizomicrobium sp.]